MALLSAFHAAVICLFSLPSFQQCFGSSLRLFSCIPWALLMVFQVRGSPNQFPGIGASSPLLFLTQGYSLSLRFLLISLLPSLCSNSFPPSCHSRSPHPTSVARMGTPLMHWYKISASLQVARQFSVLQCSSEVGSTQDARELDPRRNAALAAALQREFSMQKRFRLGSGLLSDTEVTPQPNTMSHLEQMNVQAAVRPLLVRHEFQWEK